MKVTVLGVRGIPNVQGGVETHAEHLYQRLAERGCRITVLVRSPFVPRANRTLGSIRLRRIWSPRRPGLEALVHSLLGALYAGLWERPDILHIHAIGPAIAAPVARILGLKVVVTHHGPDYDRDKWGGFARAVLRVGEYLGMRCSNARIAISRVIEELIRSRHGRDSFVIPNGVVPAQIQTDDAHVRRFGLGPGKYFLLVGRMVPEKRQMDLIEAFAGMHESAWKLALVGALSPDGYAAEVRQAADRVPGVVLTDFLNGSALQQLYSHAGAFVLPSSHEGLPIALLEALSFGLPVLASNIPANVEVGLEASSYFPLGDVPALRAGLERLQQASQDPGAYELRRKWVLERYDWDDVAARTLEVYRRTLRGA